LFLDETPMLLEPGRNPEFLSQRFEGLIEGKAWWICG
jgi:hypothetical protein